MQDLDFINHEDITDVYHFEKEIGQSLNKVAQGVHYETGEEVAIKVMDISQINENDKKNLASELLILRQLNHPNILELREAFIDEENETFYIVSELLKGGPLNDTIQEYDYLPENKAAKILYPVADAIRFMHEKGVVHRDLKVRSL